MQTREALLFDLDGTLLDSERAICHAASAAFRMLDVAVSEAEVALLLGAPLEELYDAYVGDGDPVRRRVFMEAYVELHDAHPEAEPLPFPGVAEALEALRARARLPMAVATTKPSHRAASQLLAAGLHPCFDHVQGTDPGMRPKPEPDVIVRACQALRVDPRAALMVGDTARDVVAAKRAGAVAVAIAYDDEKRRAAREFGADVVIGSVAEMLAWIDAGLPVS